MTNLQCGVDTCANNAQGCCCLPGIDVGGAHACRCGDTCCRSFHPKSEGAQNSARHDVPNPNSHISCNAKTCAYNEGGLCSASQITVKGGGADQASQTECATVRQR